MVWYFCHSFLWYGTVYFGLWYMALYGLEKLPFLPLLFRASSSKKVPKRHVPFSAARTMDPMMGNQVPPPELWASGLDYGNSDKAGEVGLGFLPTRTAD